MKKLVMVVVALLIAAAAGFAAEPKVEAPADCQLCGMNRTKFAQSRMVVTYADGSSSGTCSINCVAADMKKQAGKEVKSFQVGDYNSKKLLDAKTAIWVIGGSKKGVMTPVAKWAFAEKSSAEQFVKKNGGKLATFAEALHAAESEQNEKVPGGGHGGHKM